jgi:hypothetical protein
MVAAVVRDSLPLQDRLTRAASIDLGTVTLLIASVSLHDGEDRCSIDSPTVPPFSSRVAYRMLLPAQPRDGSSCTTWASKLPIKVKISAYLANIDRLSTHHFRKEITKQTCTHDTSIIPLDMSFKILLSL